jgi:hypothetical protein
MTTTKYYKFLTSDNKGQYSQFDFTEYLPKDGKPGKWLPKIDTLAMCNAGYHVCERKDILSWANTQMFEVEIKGKFLSKEDKLFSQQIRFTRRLNVTTKTWVEYAILCAQTVLEKFEEKYPKDMRPRQAIEAAQKWLDNPTAARAAAADAARAADAAAARAAAYAARAARADAADAADARAAAYAADAVAYAAYAARAAAYAARADAARAADAAARVAAYAAYAARAADAAADLFFIMIGEDSHETA